MYNTGFGDCFLLTFQYGKEKGLKSWKTLWIDFGVRPSNKKRMQAIARNISAYLLGLPGREQTQPFVDVLAITHEHQDHISGFKLAKDQLDKFKFGQVWFAWTEDPLDPVAQSWRQHKSRTKTTLEKVVKSINSLRHREQQETQSNPNRQENNLTAALSNPGGTSKTSAEQLAERLKLMTEFDFAMLGSDEKFKKPDESGTVEDYTLNPVYKALIEQVKATNVRYLRPGYTDAQGQVHEGNVVGINQTASEGITAFEGVKIFVLGPPKDLSIIKVNEPQDWQTTLHSSGSRDFYDLGDSILIEESQADPKDFWYYVHKSPFTEEFILPVDLKTGQIPHSVVRPMCEGEAQPRKREADSAESKQVKDIFKRFQKTQVYKNYFDANKKPHQLEGWRRIDMNYLLEADDMALRLNTGTNNTSLVLAIEIEQTKEVLLFSGDAEYGVWEDWEKDRTRSSDKRQYVWKPLDAKINQMVTVEGLLANTIFYKMGHHGSENATPKSKGINKLSNRGLHSMIPVNATTALAFGWKRIPFDDLLARLDDRDIPYVRADMAESHQLGGVELAKERTTRSPLKDRVKWGAHTNPTGNTLFVDWTLSLDSD
ncbi:hypothetical protein SAMN00120144_4119 [Hymenobacter roseosalivarius DSM 11622]|uniref:Metallo-beta-lactamase domain-containing protein n=2 Tax=Hymenobacter roseosalivarius TaxID=89967 RepID=A0A1W1UFI1_9BACT|nr:hypothetical protein SAMN00120144_4119 [Hymenobacter roseosalivarius DSM 11622]